jgi:signal recognition particle receptor subunit beta
MVFFNHATRQMTVKIVYYGPGLCGKTTNLNTIYGKTSQKARGEMVSLNTETDRTLFFDLLPMDVGMVGGFKTKLQLYTVPGQVFYNSTRKLVLKGVDGIVFVVDSQAPMLDACKESYQNLEENLRELGLNLSEIPTVFQWNKRDLRNVVPVDDLEAAFNLKGGPSFQSVASEGAGVFETLRGITKLSLSHIKSHVLGESNPVVPLPPAPAPESSRSAPAALTLSDLPSITDLLDMEGSSSSLSPGTIPLPDEDDGSDIYIESPFLPEPPEAVGDDIAFLTVDHDLPPSAVQAEPEKTPVPFSLGTEWSMKAEPELAPPPVIPIPAVPSASVPPPAVPVPVLPVAPALPRAILPPGSSKPTVKTDPLAALASLKSDALRPAPKPKAIDHRDAINSLLGELTMAGRIGSASVLRLEVPSDLDGQEIEVVVQLKHQGKVLSEGQINRPVPGKGVTAKLSVELKRS